MDFFIRRATQSDYEDLCALYAEVDALHRDAVVGVFQVPDGPPRTREFISGIIADENAGFFVAESTGHIIGLVCVRIRQSPDIPILTPRRYAKIEELSVLKRFQRQGIGRALVEKAHQWALGKQIGQVELNVWEFNEGAMAFYREIGYTTALRIMWKTLREDADKEMRR
jgi:shikimate dehydrogenase